MKEMVIHCGYQVLDVRQESKIEYSKQATPPHMKQLSLSLTNPVPDFSAPPLFFPFLVFSFLLFSFKIFLLFY